LYIIYIGRMSSYLVLSILGRSSLLGILNLYIYGVYSYMRYLIKKKCKNLVLGLAMMYVLD